MRVRFKRSAVLIIALVMVLTALPSLPAHAQVKTGVVNSRAVVVYPNSIIFTIDLESQAQITDIRLNYRVERDSFADVICEGVAGLTDDRLSARWVWDMSKTGNLPPGTLVEYWWKITKENGGSLVTQVQQVVFADHRYQWQEITQDNLSLFWYRGEQAFALELMQAAQAALSQLEADMDAHLVRPVNIYIYGSSAELQGAMLYVQEWAGGLAFTGYGVVAIGISPSNLDWGKQAMVHELAHIVTHQMTNNPYNSIPVWLNEGISMYAEGEMDEYSESYLRRAVLNGDLISVQSLASPFSANADTTYLSYAQSYSLVEYLIKEYGREKMAGLLDKFSQGADYDQAFLDTYGFDIDTLDDAWQAWVKERYDIYSLQTASLMPLYLGFVVCGLVTMAAVFIIQNKKQPV